MSYERELLLPWPSLNPMTELLERLAALLHNIRNFKLTTKYLQKNYREKKEVIQIIGRST